jgi:hypothetical protein
MTKCVYLCILYTAVASCISCIYEVRRFQLSANSSSEVRAAMLVLFETPNGYALFKVVDEGKLKQPDQLFKEFESAERAKKMYADCCARSLLEPVPLLLQ